MSKLTKQHEDNIREIFDTPHLNPAREDSPESADPITPTHIRLTLEEIEGYDHNPRKASNSAYESILDDLRPHGFEGALAVTRRPADQKYMPRRGGNTCLRALKQLWQETGDEKYHRLDCLFLPWTSEADILAAHLSENDNRGDVIFIDRANGVMELKRQLEAEQGTLSTRKLSASIKATGYSVPYQVISLMEYAVGKLQPLLPAVLGSGMGKPQIALIRKTDNAFRKIFEVQQREAEAFDPVFSAVLSAHDGPDWDVENVQSDLAHQTAELLDLPVTQVRSNLELVFAGREAVELPGRQPEPDPAEPATETSGAGNARGVRAPAGTPPSPPGNSLQEPQPGTLPQAPVPDAPLENDALPENIEQLRRRNAEAAFALTKGTIIAPSYRALDIGYGFMVDVPYATTNPTAHREEQQPSVYRDRWLWWFLAALSEVVFDQEKIRMMPAELEISQWLAERGADYCDQRIIEQATLPNWPRMAQEFLCHPGFLDDRRLELLLEPILNCRRLRYLSGDLSGEALWRAAGEDPR